VSFTSGPQASTSDPRESETPNQIVDDLNTNARPKQTQPTRAPKQALKETTMEPSTSLTAKNADVKDKDSLNVNAGVVLTLQNQPCTPQSPCGECVGVSFEESCISYRFCIAEANLCMSLCDLHLTIRSSRTVVQTMNVKVISRYGNSTYLITYIEQDRFAYIVHPFAVLTIVLF
jgi:hypothetical protein